MKTPGWSVDEACSPAIHRCISLNSRDAYLRFINDQISRDDYIAIMNAPGIWSRHGAILEAVSAALGDGYVIIGVLNENA